MEKFQNRIELLFTCACAERTHLSTCKQFEEPRCVGKALMHSSGKGYTDLTAAITKQLFKHLSGPHPRLSFTVPTLLLKSITKGVLSFSK